MNVSLAGVFRPRPADDASHADNDGRDVATVCDEVVHTKVVVVSPSALELWVNN